MSDPLSKLRGLTDEIKARETELSTYFTTLASRLREAAGGHEIYGASENCTLEEYGADDEYFGHLFFNQNDGFRVGYRTKEEAMREAHEDELWGPSYSIMEIAKCSPVWLRALASPKVIESLLTSINKRVEEELNATRSGIQTLSATANLPLRDLDGGLVAAAKKLNFGIVIEHWQEAQAALGVDPADATTRASSLIETLCKHILDAKKLPLPAKESIQPLYSAAAKALAVSPEQQETTHLKAIAGGMNTVVGGIGALRTHAGTAHGKGPGNTPITFEQARLAVNSAGVLATYLMDMLSAQNTT
jgi:hypothetical protein